MVSTPGQCRAEGPTTTFFAIQQPEAVGHSAPKTTSKYGFAANGIFSSRFDVGGCHTSGESGDGNITRRRIPLTCDIRRHRKPPAGDIEARFYASRPVSSPSSENRRESGDGNSTRRRKALLISRRRAVCGHPRPQMSIGEERQVGPEGPPPAGQNCIHTSAKQSEKKGSNGSGRTEYLPLGILDIICIIVRGSPVERRRTGACKAPADEPLG